jgi:hypothetical protein
MGKHKQQNEQGIAIIDVNSLPISLDDYSHIFPLKAKARTS